MSELAGLQPAKASSTNKISNGVRMNAEYVGSVCNVQLTSTSSGFGQAGGTSDEPLRQITETPSMRSMNNNMKMGACLAAVLLSGCLFRASDGDGDVSEMGAGPDAAHSDATSDATVPPDPDASEPDLGMPATTLTVTHVGDVDDGSCDAVHCSLREALTESGRRGGGTVDFRIEDGADAGSVIQVDEPLYVPGNTVVAHSLDAARVTVEMTGASDVLVLEGANAEVRGLRVVAQNSAPILIDVVGADARIADCDLVGGGIGVRAGAPAVLAGVSITSAAVAGVVVVHDSIEPTSISGSWIGLSRTGAAGGNGEGIRVERGDAIIGSDAARNVIGFNRGPGISARGGTASISVLGNFVGTSVDQSDATNDGPGVLVVNADRVTIGSAECGYPCNVLTNNRGPGVEINNARQVAIAGNAFGPAAVMDTECISLGANVDVAVVGRDGDLIAPSALCDGGCNFVTGCTAAGITSSAANLTLAGNHFGVLGPGARPGFPNLAQNVYIVDGNADVRANLLTQSGEESVRIEGAGDVTVTGNRLGTSPDGRNCSPAFRTGNRQSALFLNKLSGPLSVADNVIGCVETDGAGPAFAVHLPGGNRADVRFERNFLGIAPDATTVLALDGNAVWLAGGSATFVDNLIVSTVRHAINIDAAFGRVNISGGALRSSAFPALQINGGFGHLFSDVTVESQSGSGAIRASGGGLIGFTFQNMARISNNTPRLVNLGVVTPPGPNLGLAAPSFTTNPGPTGLVVGGDATVPQSTVDVYGGTAAAAETPLAVCPTGADKRWNCSVVLPAGVTHLWAFQRAIVSEFSVGGVTTAELRSGTTPIAVVTRSGNGETDDAFLGRILAAFDGPAVIVTGAPGCNGACARVAHGMNTTILLDAAAIPILGEVISEEAWSAL